MERRDVVVVGGGPAGAAAALAARAAGCSVLILDRADFPRDKVCGDGIAPEALDVLAGLGLDPGRLTEGYPAVPRLRLRSPGGTTVERAMHRAAFVVPREVFDARLLTAALASGAEFRRHTVRRVEVGPAGVEVDGSVTAGVVVAADGAESVVRRALGIPANRPAPHRDRDPRLRPRPARRAGRAGHRHDRAALAGLRVVVPAGRRAGQRRLRRTGLRRRHPGGPPRRPRRPAARRRTDRAPRPPAAAVDRATPAAGRAGAARGRRRLADQPAHRRGHLLRRRSPARSPVRRPRTGRRRGAATGGRCAGGWAGTCGTRRPRPWSAGGRW